MKFVKTALFMTLVLLLYGCDESAKDIKLNRVGIIAGVEFFEPTIQGFKDSLHTMGYEEGVNIEYTIRRAKGKKELMEKSAREFVDQGVDLIFTTTNGAALAAKEATIDSKTPVIFTIVMGPVESGIVDSLTVPSANVTGIRNPLDEFIGKRLDILKQMVPETETVLIFYDPDYLTARMSINGLQAASEKLSVKLLKVKVKSKKDIAEYITKSADLNVDALIIMPDPVVQSKDSLQLMMKFAKQKNIPVVANTPKQAQRGALFSYLSDSYETGVAAARLANNVLSQKQIKEIPIINSEPKLIINLTAAKDLSIVIDNSLINLSDSLIE